MKYFPHSALLLILLLAACSGSATVSMPEQSPGAAMTIPDADGLVTAPEITPAPDSESAATAESTPPADGDLSSETTEPTPVPTPTAIPTPPPVPTPIDAETAARIEAVVSEGYTQAEATCYIASVDDPAHAGQNLTLPIGECLREAIEAGTVFGTPALEPISWPEPLPEFLRASEWQHEDFRSEFITDVAVGPDLIVAVGSSDPDGATPLWTSADGVEWTQFENAITGFSGASHVDWTSRGFVIMNGESVWESLDGLQWSEPAAFANGVEQIRGVASSQDMIVAVGRGSGGRPAAWISSIAGTWQQTTASGDFVQNETFEGIAAGPTGFVTVGTTGSSVQQLLGLQRPTIWFSSDGRGWEVVEKIFDFTGRGGELFSVTWSEAHQAYYAAGHDGVYTDEGVGAIMLTSPDGRTWEQIDAPVFDRPDEDEYLMTIEATSDGLIASGTSLYGDDPRGYFWKSTDGREWTSAWVHGSGPQVGIGVTDDGMCISVGKTTFISSRERGGIIWTGPCDRFSDGGD